MTYDEFINNIIETRGQWGIPLNEYFEAHHIIPRCMGGDGECFRKGKRTNDKNTQHFYFFFSITVILSFLGFRV